MRNDHRINRNQRGVTIVLIAILIVVFLGLAALAIDLSHLFLVRNELQNAADAGALAGARFLYREDATAPYGIILDTVEARAKALDTATANKSENLAVEVDNPDAQDGDIQIGHWSFGIGTLAKGFYLPDGPPIYDIWNYSTQQLDGNVNFINAVKVTTRRGGSSPTASQAASFFARIFGYQGFSVSAEGVGYIGYEGTIGPGEIDLPIAICREAITDPNSPPGEQKLLCGVGRMINSGANIGHQTGGWTNFTQDPPAGEDCVTASKPTVMPYVQDKCTGSVNASVVYMGQPMGTQGGEIEVVREELIRCWQVQAGLLPNPRSENPSDFPIQPWEVRLPVIKCPDNNVTPCNEYQPVDGAVRLEILWITRAGFKDGTTCNPKGEPVPRQMGGWTCEPDSSNPDPEYLQCWKQFVQTFGLKDVLNNSDACAEDKTIYFRPSCEEMEIGGQTGGHNYGILAKIPVLVK